MTGDARLGRLAQITGARLAAAQARLARARRREQELSRALADLSAEAHPAMPDSPAARAGADLLWQRWAEARRRDIHLELARCRADEEGLRAALARANAQDRAVLDLARKKRQQLRQRQERRAERGGG